jgi:aspartate/methionine/tyrosine aminotransferase
MPETKTLLDSVRPTARNLPESGIVAVFNHGRNKPGLIPLWVGEGELPTPAFITDAVTRSLQAGETFYTYQRGIPELREELARYHARVFGEAPRLFTPERFFVTGSGGMQAIQLAMQATIEPGEECVLSSPAWPNFAAAIQGIGARPVPVPMPLGNDSWRLDIEQLFAACGDKTRAIFLNSPSNPLGWTATAEELAAILSFARRRGIWLIVDEVYSRFYYEAAHAPTLYHLIEPDDRVLMVNTFSKNWAMTGWRMGWLNAPEALGGVIENLIQYNTSGCPVFMQRAGVVALRDGEPFVKEQVDRSRIGRDIVCDALAACGGRVRFARPKGAFYLFFAIDGIADTLDAALRIVEEAGVGLAPGAAFGPGGEGYLRLCFARSKESLTQAADRLAQWIRSL